jgi:hypothetical protein
MHASIWYSQTIGLDSRLNPKGVQIKGNRTTTERECLMFLMKEIKTKLNGNDLGDMLIRTLSPNIKGYFF